MLVGERHRGSAATAGSVAGGVRRGGVALADRLADLLEAGLRGTFGAAAAGTVSAAVGLLLGLSLRSAIAYGGLVRVVRVLNCASKLFPDRMSEAIGSFQRGSDARRMANWAGP